MWGLTYPRAHSATYRVLSAADPLYAFSFAPDEGYVEPLPPAPVVETYPDPVLGSNFAKITSGEYQYGSTYVEANDAFGIVLSILWWPLSL